jgi:hypothetical protein
VSGEGADLSLTLRVVQAQAGWTSGLPSTNSIAIKGHDGISWRADSEGSRKVR